MVDPFGMAERWRISDLEAHEAGEGSALLFDRASGQARLLPIDDVHLLLSCDVYRELPAHAARWGNRREIQAAGRISSKAPRWLSRVIGGAADSLERRSPKTDPILAKLKTFAEDGFLLPLSGLARPSSKNHAPSFDAPPPPVTTFGFTTRNRPVELERAVRSYVENLREFDRKAGFAVIDDSSAGAGKAGTRKLLARLAAELEVPIRFAGRSRRLNWAAELAAAAGVDPSLTEFALLGDERCPLTTGSARNSLLLDCAGECYILADDDGLCRVAMVPEAEQGWELSSRRDPTEFWYYRGRDEMVERAEWARLDLAGLHERLLGHESSALWESLGEPVADRASTEFERRLRARGARVRATMAGIVGDSGLGGSAYLFADPASRTRLTVSEKFYRQVVESRQMLRASRRLTVADSSICMAGNLGLDHALLLPPFSPVQRNSDGLFGRLLKRCFPRSAMGYLPEAALHDPIEARKQSLDDWFEIKRSVRYPDYLIHLIADWPGAAATPESALGDLGKFLREAASQPQQDFEAIVRRRLLHTEAPRLNRDRSRESREMPAFYAKLRLRQLDVVRHAIARDEHLVPRDLTSRVDGPETARGLAREMVGKTGLLLEAWPAIREAAVQLKAQGKTLTQPA